jgi:very-short-patch-repair endonuclease
MSSDRQRDRVAATHGWIVVRFTWSDLMEKRDEVVATVATLLQDRSTS